MLDLSSEPHLESGTKNSTDFRWAAGRFEEFELSRMHCLGTLEISVIIASSLLLCFIIQQ